MVIEYPEMGDFLGEIVCVGCRVVARDTEQYQQARADLADYLAGDFDASFGYSLQDRAHRG
jgi:hypothetical protein